SQPPPVPEGRTHTDAPETDDWDDPDQRSPGERAQEQPDRTIRVRRTGLIAGVVGALAVFWLMPGDAPTAARVTAGTAVLMGLWWMTAAIPIPAAALLPLVIFPVVGGADIAEVGASYGSDIIFLFMGGFIL